MGVILLGSSFWMKELKSFPRYGGYSNQDYQKARLNFVVSPLWGAILARGYFLLQGVINYVNRNL